MSKIVKQDTNGVKPLLAVGELGYDNYPSGGDIGRVYVGTGSSNIAQAKKSEVVTVDGKVDAHVARIDNPHGVTKAQVGLNNVDNTADSAKVVDSAGKWTTSRLINGTAVNGTIDITTSQWGTSRNITIGNTTKSVNGSADTSWSLAEIGAIGTDSPAFTGVPTAPTATVNTNTTQLATTAFVNAEIANDAIPRVTSINTAIPKFDGVSGAIQSSNILINSSDNVILPKASGGSLTISLVDGVTNTEVIVPESGILTSVDGSVTNNAIARYDSTTGKLQNSGVTIDDSNNITTAGSVNGASAAFTTVTGSLTGNASTATNLQTARTINGVSFDGSANISVGLDRQSGVFSTPFTLNTAHKNKLLVCENGITITLPTINTMKSGDLFYITNGGLDPLTLALNGNSTNLNTLKVTKGETLVIQSDGGVFYRSISRNSIPIYDFDTNLNVVLGYNTVYQADVDLTLIVLCYGNYMNGIEIVIGTTTSPTRIVSRIGDDINSNTKYATLTAVITAGLYFKVQGFGGHAFEAIEITAYKHK